MKESAVTGPATDMGCTPCRIAASWATVVLKLSRMPCSRRSSSRLTRRPPMSAQDLVMTG